MLRQKPSRDTLAIYKRGHRIEKLAHQLFPGGILVAPPSPRAFNKAAQVTELLMANGQEVIYEATFVFEGVMCAVDILVKERNKWSFYEVKSSPKEREVYKQDLGIQYWVMAQLGIILNKAFLVRAKSIKLTNVVTKDDFIFTDYTSHCKKLQAVIDKKIMRLGKVRHLDQPPEIKMSPHCDQPYSCDFKTICSRQRIQ